MNIKNTLSEKNLRAALAGESMARNKYTYYAEQARKEGLEDTALLFDKMAENEMNHAKVWFKTLHDGIKTTTDNLQEAMKGENGEWLTMYPGFAKTAREEGLEDLAIMFEKVATIEASHEKRFMEEYIKIKTSQGIKVAAPQAAEKKEELAYRCALCGDTIKKVGKTEAPYVCGVCEAMGAYEEVLVKF